jgi:5'-phosphate synthase pdxT subunit
VTKIGVLALQGDFACHAALLGDLGATAVEVRAPEGLDGVDAVVLPGGESTTMSLLLGSSGLDVALGDRLAAGLPAMGTCAGMILLAREVLDGVPGQVSFDAIDVTVRRNAYGRQRDSFEADLALDLPGQLAGPPFPAVFIRAPAVERVGPGVEVLATVDGEPVLCREGAVLVAAFHPELSADRRVHELFLGGLA